MSAPEEARILRRWRFSHSKNSAKANLDQFPRRRVGVEALML
ncbi:hypothetical protein BN130_1300 [Cronobacter malonaticus 507]|nr:hypothetical protein BN130_1300 [Cronobacter malonaticus 507]